MCCSVRRRSVCCTDVVLFCFIRLKGHRTRELRADRIRWRLVSRRASWMRKPPERRRGELRSPLWPCLRLAASHAAIRDTNGRGSGQQRRDSSIGFLPASRRARCRNEGWTQPVLLLLLLLLAERIVGRRGDVLAVRRVWGRAEHRLSVEKGSPRKRSLHGRGTRQRQERPAPFCRPLLATRHSNQDDRPCPLAFYPRGPGLAAFAQAEEIASLYCDKKGSPTELAVPRKSSKLGSSAQRVSARHANVVKRVCTGYPVAHRA